MAFFGAVLAFTALAAGAAATAASDMAELSESEIGDSGTERGNNTTERNCGERKFRYSIRKHDGLEGVYIAKRLGKC